ncbi:MAG TPA: PAS domain S-box protein [Rubricoccaceae bacterium]|nr:PAS domain S-box protein [Rubricoccaceae bacterium]
MATRMRAVAATAPGVVTANTRGALRTGLEEACRGALPFDALAVWTYDTAADALHALGQENSGDGAGATPVAGAAWERVVRERRSFVGPTGDVPSTAGAGRPAASVLLTPILAGTEVLGALALESSVPDRYTPQDVEVAEVVAALAAAALLNLRLAEERRAAERARRVSESRFRTMFEQFPLSVQIFDVEGRTLVVNRAWEALFKLPREAVEHFNPLTDPQLEPVREYLLRGFGGEPVTIPPHPFTPGPLAEQAALPGERPMKWLEVTVWPIHDPDGGIREVVVVHHDVTERKEATDALEHARQELEQRVAERTVELVQAEQRFRAIVEASPTPLLLSRISDGVILYANERIEALVGVPPGSLVGKKTPDFYWDPGDRPHVLHTVAAQGYVRDLELRIRRADGTPRWVSLTVQQLLYNGVPVVATALLDVTERKQTEEALRASEESYRGLFDTLTELVYVQDLEGRFLNVNEAVVRAYGYPREELIGQTPGLLAAPGLVDLADTMARFERAVAGEPQRFEWWGRRKDGTVFPKELTLKRSTYFGQDVVIAVARDVSERVEAEAALRASEEHFRRLIENASDIITIIDPDGTVRYQSAAIKRVLGYEQDELVGRNVFEFLAPEDVVPTVERLRRLAENPGIGVSAEFRFRHKDGSWRTLEGVGTTLSPTSPDEGVVVNSRDITERKQAEAALREKDALKRGIVDSALDCIISIDSEGCILEFNPAAERTFGYRAEEVLGRHMADLIVPPHLREAHTAGLARYRETGEGHVLGQRIEVPAVRADGAEFPAELAIDVVRLENGAEVFTAYLRDITERKRAEAALRESEIHFRRLIENASDLITIIGPDGISRYQSPSFERVLGYRPEERTGTEPFELMHPDDVATARETLLAMLRNPGTVHRTEFRYRHKDGSWRVFEATGRTLLPDSAAEGVVVNSRDITERVEAEQRVRFQKTLLEAEGEASIDGILVVSTDGKILSYNARFVELWGIPREVVAARSDEGAIQAVLDKLVDPQTFLDRVAYLYAHPDEQARDELLLRDGRVFDRYSAPVRSSEGEHYGRIWFFRDITAEKRHAEELEQARQEAERAREEASRYAESLERSLEELRAAQAHLVQQEKMASLGRVTAGIAHEIKNPLNFVTNFAQLDIELMEDLRRAVAAGDTPEQEELLANLAENARKVQEHARRADAIVRGMMEHARGAPSDRGLRRPVAFNDLVEEQVVLAVEERRLRNPALACTVHRDYDPRAGSVNAEPDALGRVVLCLLSNALDALEARADREGAAYTPTIAVRTRREGLALTLAVADNGIGIPEEAKARVFEPFFTTKPAGTGHPGLGLSLAHETVVSDYEGTLDVESTEGEGTTFTLTLPDT